MRSPSTPNELVEGQSATPLLRAAGLSLSNATPTYVRHKPGETTIVAYQLDGVDGQSTFGYAHWCVNPARAAQIFAKANSLRPRPSPLGSGLVMVDRHTVLYLAPNDARLRRMRWYLEPRKLKRSLADLSHLAPISGKRSTVTLLRYKPERRVVVSADLARSDTQQRVVIRYTTGRQAIPLANAARHLRSHGIPTPEPLLQTDGGRVGVDEFIDGTVLRTSIIEGSIRPVDVAASLLQLHRTPPPNVGPRSAAGDLERVKTGLTGLSHWLPTLEGECGHLNTLLERLIPGPGEPVTLHGDLHTKNILVGSAIAFVDLERLAVGAAEVDLGWYHAHAIATAIRFPGLSPNAATHAAETLDHYQRKQPVDSSALAWHTAIGLAEQAVLVSRHLESDWRDKAFALLRAALDQLTHIAQRTPTRTNRA